MKIRLIPSIGHIRPLVLAVLLVTGLTAQAQTPLYDGHTDIGIDYDNDIDEWNLHVHYEVTDTEYSPPTNALLIVKSDAHSTVPNDPDYSFLGAVGSDIWLLPKVQDTNLLFLGFGAEEIADGTFLNNIFTMALKGVDGPGNFFVYDNGAFNEPIVWMNSANGIDGNDSVELPSGAHSHINWIFTAPGEYTVLFEASAIRESDSQPTASGEVAYKFYVEPVPEPTTMAMLGLGCTALIVFRRRR